ncbi:hypothetical protein THAOC_23205 [Thalassiosira oceanica]|uniref:peptidylprolyl isomerase n=1 Tax=Thalassiosira oceanica TaxID=159749 RepID=K0S7E6_THAOC|nr:hypothetical protein THAOC_23205 [Thalassiosira oceanica]|eukprot:EJK56826.1 hypothetical protein THAOC_23205 [Thalassiosira oceanica]
MLFGRFAKPVLAFVVASLVLVCANAGWRNRERKRTKRRLRDGSIERLDLANDEDLRIGIKFRPKRCKERSSKGDYLSVHYNGTFYSSGKEFDSSILREEPFVFQLGMGRTIPGWERGLQNMCVNERRRLVVPAGMAYGETGGFGSERKIHPNATLVYEVELLHILDENEAAPHVVWGI